MSYASILLNFVIYFLVPIAAICYWWIQKSYSYWKGRNVPFPEPTWKNLAGNMSGVGTTHHFSSRLIEIYSEFKGKAKAVGIYMGLSPQLLLIDTELVKTICVRDFSKFSDHGFYYNEKDDPLSAHLFNLEGAKWRYLRNKLSPTFTSGKLKMMFSSIEQTGDHFIKVLDKYATDQSPIDVKDLSRRFTTDVVGSTAFGLNVNCLGGEHEELLEFADKLVDGFSFENLGTIFKVTFPNLAKKLRLPLFSREISEYFMNMIRETVDYREKNDAKRNDFLQLLIQLKNKGFVEGDESGGEVRKLTFNEMAPQAFVFFFAGFDTSSTAMNYTMFELAKNPEIQEKARQDVLNEIAKHGGKMTYEALMDMDYLNKVFNEALRMYPPVLFLMRKANEDYTIPDTNMRIEEGTNIIIPVHSFHMDPDFYPNPYKFDPERFSKENIEGRPHFAFLPFGEGPRICIGNRFAQLQSRFALALVLKNFKLTISDKMQMPLKMKNNYPGWFTEGGTWLNVTRI